MTLLLLIAASGMVFAIMAALGRAAAFVAGRRRLLAWRVVLGVAGSAVL
ncbi:hypothetical protein [uncultured Pseudacidovorax sp.]|nr:hypothetical protein [uncultured Pseudacidovorax sp.]